MSEVEQDNVTFSEEEDEDTLVEEVRAQIECGHGVPQGHTPL